MGLATAQIPLNLCSQQSLFVSPLDGIQCLHRAGEYQFFFCSTKFGVSICSSPKENFAYDFVLTAPVVLNMFFSY